MSEVEKNSPKAEKENSSLISRRAAINALDGELEVTGEENAIAVVNYLNAVRERIKCLPAAQQEIIRCKDCKHNPKDAWFGCPMSHLSETQKPDMAWCWKGERKNDKR